MKTIAITKSFTAAEAKVLHSAPVQFLAAPGAGKAFLFDKAFFHMEHGDAAFAGVAGGEDLSLNYGTTAALGTAVGVLETTGFLDQTNDEDRVLYPTSDVSTAMLSIDGAPTIENKGLVLSLLSGDITNAGTTTKLVVTVIVNLITVRSF